MKNIFKAFQVFEDTGKIRCLYQNGSRQFLCKSDFKSDLHKKLQPLDNPKNVNTNLTNTCVTMLQTLSNVLPMVLGCEKRIVEGLCAWKLDYTKYLGRGYKTV